MDQDKRLREKQRLLGIFDTIDKEGDDEQLDFGRKASEQALRKMHLPTKKTLLPPPLPRHRTRPLARAASDSHVQSATQLPDPRNVSACADSLNGITANRNGLPPSQLRKTVSNTTTPAGPTLPIKLTGKRKRESTIKTAPEDQQLFRNLHFYFFPNDDKNPARRMRINKAREFGATWQKDWNSSVTHVIVDKNLDFSSLLKWLRVERLPEDVIVVSESYPAECISYRMSLPPAHVRFAVSGFTIESTPGAPLEAPPSSVESNRSLQLKPIERATASCQNETPEEGLEPSSLDTAAKIRKLIPTNEEPERISDSFQQRGVNSSKELDEAIAQARALEHISFDDEHRPNSSEEPESGDDQVSVFKLMRQRSTVRNENRLARDEKFQCMQKHTGDKSGNPNEAIIDILQQMATYYGQTGDEWRVRAYRKAMATLRNTSEKIITKEQAASLPNVGPRLAEKIEEIALTNRLRRLENAKAEPQDQVLQTFMGVYGAGLKQANKWIDEGFTTLDELLEKASLNKNQRIGVEHYSDFNSRIPRNEVRQHGEFVATTLRKIDPACEVIIGGSYRRGAKDSGDIDCIITRPETGADHLRQLVLSQLVPQLESQGFIVAGLALTSHDDGSKWHGASCLPGSTTWRRLDFLLVPSDELGAALIYFTGNDIFNRSLRLLASVKGMRLNQRGLFKDVLRGKGRAKLTEGTLVEGKDEKRIFELLGVPWRPPEHRIC